MVYRYLWLICVLFCFAAGAYAQSNDPISRKSLEGISAFGIVVEEPSPDLLSSGLTRANVTNDVSMRLRRQGLRILNEEELSKEPGGPYLRVIITGRKTASPQVVSFVITVQFEQAVLPTRYLGKPGEAPRLDKSVFASTWGVNGLGSAGADAVARVIREGVTVFVDQFIHAYQTENPPR